MSDQPRTVLSSAPAWDPATLAELQRLRQEHRWLHRPSFEAGPGVAPPDGMASVERPLLAHQREAIDALRTWWSQDKQTGVLCLPTGAGKTRTAVYFVLRHAMAAGPVLWLTHRQELLAQALAAFLQGAEHDAMRPLRVGRFDAEQKVDLSMDVVVASIPSLTARRQAGLRSLLRTQERPFALAVVDECHHATARTWKTVIDHVMQTGTRVLGLSATPLRHQERERPALWRVFRRVIHESRPIEMIKLGVLARPHVHLVETGRRFEATPSEQTQFSRLHDLPPSLVERVAGDAERNRLVVQTYLRDSEKWGRTLIFAATIAQARVLTAWLQAHAVPAKSVFGSSPNSERQLIVQELREERLLVVVNVAVLSEGTDIPGVQTVLVARPTRSRVLFQQMVGRAMRGPTVGGVSDANIVVFHDHLVGLANDQLAVSFSDEAAVLSTLGLAETTTPATKTKPEAEPNDLSDGEIRKLVEAWMALGQVELVGRESELLGWWEVAAVDEARYLPVCTENAAYIDGWAASLRRAVTGRTRPPTPPVMLSPGLVQAAGALASLAVASGVVPRFVDVREEGSDARSRIIAQLKVTAPGSGADNPSPWRSRARQILARPMASPPSMGPTPESLLRELRGLPENERREALDLYSRAFARHTSLELLYRMLLASRG